MRDVQPSSSSSSSSPPSIKRSASPARLVRPSTLRATYSHASLRSVAAPSLAQESAPSPHLSSFASSTSPEQYLPSSLAQADGVLLSESLVHDNTNVTGVQGMVLAGTDMGSEVASTTLSSSATSTTGSERGDPSAPSTVPVGSLVVNAEVDPVDADGVVDPIPGEAKLALRDHLRRRLSESVDAYPVTQHDRAPNLPPIHELHHDPGDDFPERHYFILTNAGKPVFISREVQGSDNSDLTSAMGLMQALISVFADDGDKIRCINAGRTRISFLLRAPLYYACVSSWREPESVTRIHLDYLHQQILSVVTGAQLRRIFEKRTNFDLRRLLDGTEGFLFSLISKLEQDFGLVTGSLAAVRLEPTLRLKAGDLLVPPKDYKDVLYALLLSRAPSPRVITLTRPKKQSIHPSDLHILLNTLSSNSLSANSAASSSAWLPICLPKYNAEGFLYVYVSFMSDENAETKQADDTTTPESSSGHDRDDDLSNGSKASPSGSPSGAEHAAQQQAGNEICLVLITPQRDDFDKMHAWAGSIEEKLRSSGLLKSLISSCRRSAYSVNELAIPGLRHFLYQSRSHVQITSPSWEDPYDEPNDRNRLITLYQTVHDALHARSGQRQGPLKLQCIRTEKEIVMGWITQPFQLLFALSPHLPKTAVVSAANSIAKWVKKEEGRLFIRDAPVF